MCRAQQTISRHSQIHHGWPLHPMTSNEPRPHKVNARCFLASQTTNLPRQTTIGCHARDIHEPKPHKVRALIPCISNHQSSRSRPGLVAMPRRSNRSPTKPAPWDSLPLKPPIFQEQTTFGCHARVIRAWGQPARKFWGVMEPRSSSQASSSGELWPNRAFHKWALGFGVSRLPTL